MFCSQGYTVSIEAYGEWAGKFMSISYFRQIRSAYYTDFGESEFGDKCHKLIFLIRHTNQPTARDFELCSNAAFGAGGIATHSHFCCDC